MSARITIKYMTNIAIDMLVLFDACSQPALQVLLSFHNAMNGVQETPDTVDPEELALIARKSAQTLLTKTKVLRRQRLSIIFDKYCWVVPQGALMHMMITIPYWFG